jgi:hypothetical protein
MTRRNLLVAALIGLLVLAGAGIVLARATGTHKQALDPHGTALPAQRTVQLSTVMPSPSDYDGLHAKLVGGGTMPAAETQATVLTDEQCQPDAEGISHCLNRLRLSDGTEIAVRHPHNMQKVPCLSPGEHVQVVPAL